MSEDERRKLPDDRAEEVVLTRPNLRWFDRVRKYKVVLNGVTTSYTLSNDETIRVPLSPGTHNLALKIDWTGSQLLALTLQPGEVCFVKVERPGDLLSTDQYLRLVRHG